jgi:hypothetical protein
VRSVTVREPEWGEKERAKVLAYLEYEAQVCSGCGGWLPETTARENEGRYHAELPGRCHRCDALQLRQDEYANDKVKRPGALVLWPVRKR